MKKALAAFALPLLMTAMGTAQAQTDDCFGDNGARRAFLSAKDQVLMRTATFNECMNRAQGPTDCTGIFQRLTRGFNDLEKARTRYIRACGNR